ncbi:HlyU family transcriptional regulator [Rhizobium sp. 18065]|uniref:HlyU family transcriptional regulator n=1 Tax=Rhizobium sp. 18065 TaxID=2681411 RepID=UPI0013589648|nr:HlyU family transcriptional regulator [Rhizobium sp. 18065]
MTSIIARILSIFTGSSSSEAAQAPVAEPQVYKDCLIHAEPIREGGQYRLAGRIVKDVSGRTLERTFIRADIFSSLDDALECTFRKAQQIVDQNGPSLFSDGEEKRSA